MGTGLKRSWLQREPAPKKASSKESRFQREPALKEAGSVG